MLWVVPTAPRHTEQSPAPSSLHFPYHSEKLTKVMASSNFLWEKVLEQLPRPLCYTSVLSQACVALKSAAERPCCTGWASGGVPEQRRAAHGGVSVLKAFRAVCLNPVRKREGCSFSFWSFLFAQIKDENLCMEWGGAGK